MIKELDSQKFTQLLTAIAKKAIQDRTKPENLFSFNNFAGEGYGIIDIDNFIRLLSNKLPWLDR